MTETKCAAGGWNAQGGEKDKNQLMAKKTFARKTELRVRVFRNKNKIKRYDGPAETDKESVALTLLSNLLSLMLTES